MSKKKKWLITATCLVVLGFVMFVVGMAKLEWDFDELSNVNYETNTHVVDKAFSNISVDTGTADITFVPAEDGTCKVVCYEAEDQKHTVEVVEDTLTIKLVDERDWHEHISISLEATKVTVYLPETEYTSLRIKESTGDVEIPKEFLFESIDITASTGAVSNFASASSGIKVTTSTGAIRVENVSAASLELTASTGAIRVENVSAASLELTATTGAITVSGATCDGDLRLKVSTGKTKLTDVRCDNLLSDGSTGTLEMNNVIAAEKFSIERSTGSVIFDGCDAAEIFIETDTGDVEGSLLTEKVFLTQSDTGRIDVPKTITGGRCEISTDTGDIKVEIAP